MLYKSQMIKTSNLIISNVQLTLALSTTNSAIVLLVWEANIDIQPLFNYYKAVTYMCFYLPKEDHECSQAMKQLLNPLSASVALI